MDNTELLREAYDAFNQRNLEDALALMCPEVDWPNGMEGGRVHGHQGVRDYWTRQWAIIDPHVDPVEMAPDEQGRIVVDVHQVVRDLSGKVLMDQMVQHLYTIREGLIERMDIGESK
jgi:hypothetical protein